MRNEQEDQNNNSEGKSGIDNILRTLVFLIPAIWGVARSQQPSDNKADETTSEIAEWTKVVARWTRRLVYVGIITAAVLGFQFYALWRTDQTNRDTNRAVLTSYEIGINKIGDGDTASWEISPFLENAGNTSAVDVRYRLMRIYSSPIWQMRRVHISGLDPDTSEYEFDGLPSASVSLAPHSKISLGTIDITDNAREMIRLGTLGTFFFGEAEYFDVFEKWHRTKFCYRLVGSSISVNDDSVGAASNIGNIHVIVPGELETVRNEMSYRLCRRNNCVDDQCENNHQRPALDKPALELVREYPPSPSPYPPNAIIRVEKSEPPKP